MSTQLEKRHKSYLPTSPKALTFNEDQGRLAFSRFIAVNVDLNLLYPYVDGRRLSDVEALARGFIPPQLQQKVLSTLRNVSSNIDNSGLTNDAIARQAKYNSIGLERSERVNVIESSGLLDSVSDSNTTV